MSKLCKDYLVYTCLIAIICWGGCAICSLNGILMNENYFLYIPYAIGGLSPTIASWFASKKNNKVASFREWLRNIFDFRHNLLSYFMVIVLAILFILPKCLIFGYENGLPLYAIFVLTPAMIFGGGLEEEGWRHILQPELEKKYNFVIATLIIWVIWSLWHLPLFYIQGVNQYGQSFLVFVIDVLGISFALASIKKITNSVWLCVLFHCLVNSLWDSIFIINDTILGSIVTAIILIFSSFLLIKVNDKKKIFN